MLKIISAQRLYDPDEPGEIETLPEEVDLPIVTPEEVPMADEEEQGEPVITQPPEETAFLEEIPERYFIEDEESLIEEAIYNRQCISFEYTSLAGRFLGWRLIEPMGIWTANTGNRLVCGFDRHRQNPRAFSIAPENMSNLKYMEGDFYHFEPKFVFNPQ